MRNNGNCCVVCGHLYQLRNHPLSHLPVYLSKGASTCTRRLGSTAGKTLKTLYAQTRLLLFMSHLPSPHRHQSGFGSELHSWAVCVIVFVYVCVLFFLYACQFQLHYVPVLCVQVCVHVGACTVLFLCCPFYVKSQLSSPPK